MSNRFRIYLACLAACSTIFFAACSDDPPTNTPTSNEASLAGVLLDEQGYIVPNAQIEVVDASQTVVGRDSSDETGAFSLRVNGLTKGFPDLKFRIMHSDFRTYEMSVDFAVQQNPSPQSLKINMIHVDSACGSLRLYVREDATLNAIADATVKLWRNGQLVTTAMTDAGGRVEFSFLVAGKYGLSVSKDGFKGIERSFTVVNCDSSSFDVRMVVGGNHQNDTCCQGHLTIVPADANNNVLQNANVKVTPKNAPDQHRVQLSGPNGVTFGEMCPGEYWVRIARDGYSVDEFDVTMGCDEDKSVTRTLNQIAGHNDSCCHGTLTVVVVDTLNQAVMQAEVKLMKNGQKINLKYTGTNGVEFNELCEGEYGVRIARGDHYEVDEFEVQMGCNETKTVSRVLKGRYIVPDSCCKGVLTMTVYEDGTTNPIDHATVKLWKSGAIKETVTTNAQGVAIIDGICEGQYGVSVLRDGYKAKETNLTFGCSESKNESMSLVKNHPDTCHTAILKLRLKDGNTSAWISGATVTVSVGNSVVATGTSNQEGWYEAQNLTAPSGYTVLIQKAGYQDKTMQFKFTECKTYTETITMQ